MNPMLLWAAFVAVPQTSGGFDNRKLSVITEMIDAVANRGAGPSISVAVAVRGDVVLTRTAGLANIEWGQRATAETIYETASISKQFTAALVMRLIERGALRLDDRLEKYVKVPDAWREVTVEELLRHTSGIASFTESGKAFDETFSSRRTFDDLIGLVWDKPLRFKPGTGFSYSNTNYLLLTRVVEGATGQGFNDLVDVELIKPLKLEHTSVCDSRRITPLRAAGYHDLAGRTINAPHVDSSVQAGCGFICSTPSDLVRWSTALAGGKVVSRASYRDMTDSDGYGLGVQVANFAGRVKVFHGGDIPGFTGVLDNYGGGELVVAALSNSDSGPATIIAEQIARVFYDEPLLPKQLDLPLTEEEAQKYVGDYSTLRVVERYKYVGGHLVETSPSERDEDNYSVLVNQGRGIFVFRNRTRPWMRFTIKPGESRASSMAFGDGKTWQQENPRVLAARAKEER